MTCQPVFSAVQTPRPSGDDPAFFRACRQTREAASDTALITSLMHKLRYQPPLVLTHAMRQDAFQLDHDRALRGNRARAGRIAQEAKAATTAALRKATCSARTELRAVTHETLAQGDRV